MEILSPRDLSTTLLEIEVTQFLFMAFGIAH
jgi:hypothetical protein